MKKIIGIITRNYQLNKDLTTIAIPNNSLYNYCIEKRNVGLYNLDPSKGRISTLY